MKPSPRNPFPTNLASDGEIHALRVGDVALAVDDRRALLERVRAGEAVTIEVDATTFAQRPTPNRNFVRFKHGALGALARSFRGVPFQRNHSTDVEDRGGTVIESKLERIDVKGEPVAVFRQTLRLVKPWAVEGVLDGTIDRFSIAWRGGHREALCTICGKRMLSGDCPHFPGQVVVDEKTGAGRVAEIEYQSAEGVEVSAVSVPAVVGTEIEDIRNALAAARSVVPQKEIEMGEIAVKLGLSVEATEKEILAEMSKREVLSETVKAALADVEERAAKAEAKLADAEAQRLAERRVCVVERAVAEGRLIKGEDGTPARANFDRFVAFAEQSVDLAESTLPLMPRIVPLGTPSQSATADPIAKTVIGEPTLGLSDAEKNAARQMGLGEDQMLAAKRRRLGMEE